MSIFRKEIVGNQHRFYGDILIVVPPSINRLVYITLLVGVGIVLFCFLGEFTKKENIQGVLLPQGGIVNISSRQSGVITNLMVKEGDMVKVGQPLYIIGTETNTQAEGGVRSGVKNLLTENVKSVTRQLSINEKINNQKKVDLNLEIDLLNNKHSKTSQLLEIKMKQFEIMEATNRSFVEADKRNLISKVELRERSSQLLSLHAQLKELTLQLDELEYQIKKKKSDLVTSNNQFILQNEQLNNRITDVKQQLITNSVMQEFVVQSPIDGIVSAINVYRGIISQDTTLLNLEPQDKKLQAVLFVPSRAIGFLKKGQEVFLQYEPFPYQKFGQYRGVINEVSGSTIPIENIQYIPSTIDIKNKSAFVYIVKIDLDSQYIHVYDEKTFLRAGMNLTASIRVEKRKIYEWLFDPFKKMNGYI